jgi:head-tail adaptor
MLSAAELAQMRAVQMAALPGSAVIERASLASDGMGGFDEVWAAVGTVAARLYPQNVRALPENAVGGAAVISETRWFVTLPVGSTVTATDRLLIGGRSWEVLAVNNSEMWQTAVRCEVQAFGEERRV